jgi:hypothetical protein
MGFDLQLPLPLYVLSLESPTETNKQTNKRKKERKNKTPIVATTAS